MTQEDFEEQFPSLKKIRDWNRNPQNYSWIYVFFAIILISVLGTIILYFLFRRLLYV